MDFNFYTNPLAFLAVSGVAYAGMWKARRFTSAKAVQANPIRAMWMFLVLLPSNYLHELMHGVFAAMSGHARCKLYAPDDVENWKADQESVNFGATTGYIDSRFMQFGAYAPALLAPLAMLLLYSGHLGSGIAAPLVVALMLDASRLSDADKEIGQPMLPVFLLLSPLTFGVPALLAASRLLKNGVLCAEGRIAGDACNFASSGALELAAVVGRVLGQA